MTSLNADAADLLRTFAPNAVTDVTGFGLLGHAYEMASRSSVALRIDAAALPALPGALELAAQGIRTGGDRRNRDYVGAHLTVDGVSDAELALAFDPQTAGGLLASVPEPKAQALEAAASGRGLFLERIGAVEAGSGVLLAGST